MREAIEHGFWPTVGATCIVIVVTFGCLIAYDLVQARPRSERLADVLDAQTELAETGTCRANINAEFFRAVGDIILVSAQEGEVTATEIDALAAAQERLRNLDEECPPP